MMSAVLLEDRKRSGIRVGRCSCYNKMNADSASESFDYTSVC